MTRSPSEYLVEDDVVDFKAPVVAALADVIWSRSARNKVAFSRLAYEHVRDRIHHSCDVGDPRVTLTASETLEKGVGICFAKAHLLTALLRARSIPAGLCYQRLTDDGTRHQLHGLVAVHLQKGWHRLDPRGNKPGIDAGFSLGSERLAWPVRPELDERDYPEVFVHPHPGVVAALGSASNVLELCADGLPEAL